MFTLQNYLNNGLNTRRGLGRSRSSVQKVSRYQQKRIAGELKAMSDHQLEDIGICRGDIDALVRKNSTGS